MKEFYEQRENTCGDTMFLKVPAHVNAIQVLKEMGYEVADARVQPIIVRDWFTGRPKDNGYVHVYFFNKEGIEIGYWTQCLNILTILKTPRVWDKNVFNATEPLT